MPEQTSNNSVDGPSSNLAHRIAAIVREHTDTSIRSIDASIMETERGQYIDIDFHFHGTMDATFGVALNEVMEQENAVVSGIQMSDRVDGDVRIWFAEQEHDVQIPWAGSNEED